MVLRILFVAAAMVMVPARPVSSSLSFISSDRPAQVQTAIYAIPDEGETVLFRCTQDGGHPVEEWILPNGDRVSLRDENILLRPNHTRAFDSKDKYIFTKHVLEIPSVKLDMDGRYTCVFDEGLSRRSFFIPYVISHIGFSNSALLSLSISGVFCLLCLLVLFADCYFSRRNRVHSGDSVTEPITPRRKGHIMPVETLDSTSFSSINMELEDLPPMFLPNDFSRH